MNINNIIKFSIDAMYRKKYKIIFIVLAMSMAMIIIATTFIPNKLLTHSYNNYESNLKQEINCTGYINMNNTPSTEEFKKAFKDISEINGITAIGCWKVNEISGKAINELALRQNKYDLNNTNEKFVFTEIDDSIIDLINIECMSGQWVHNNQDLPEYKYQNYIYLGSGFSDIPVGTVFEIGDNFSYKVMGILKEGTYWPSTIGNSDTNLEMNLMDFSAISVRSEKSGISGCPSLFAINSDTDMNNVLKQIRDKGLENNISISSGTLKELFYEKDKNINMLLNCIMQITYILVLAIVIIQSCIQIVDIMSYNYNYGIMYANGLSTTDLIKIIIMEYFIRYILSFFIAIMSEMYILDALYGKNLDSYKATIEIFKDYSLYIMLIISLMITIISAIIPIIVIKYKTPVKLLENS